MLEFTSQDILYRRAKRLAELLKDHWEEGKGFDTRFFDQPVRSTVKPQYRGGFA